MRAFYLHCQKVIKKTCLWVLEISQLLILNFLIAVLFDKRRVLGGYEATARSERLWQHAFIIMKLAMLGLRGGQCHEKCTGKIGWPLKENYCLIISNLFPEGFSHVLPITSIICWRFVRGCSSELWRSYILRTYSHLWGERTWSPWLYRNKEHPRVWRTEQYLKNWLVTN